MIHTKLKTTGKAKELKRPHFAMDSKLDASLSPLDQHPIAGELNIEARIDWVVSLSKQHGLSEGPLGASIEEVKEQILARQRESRLFVGVIGEFSSGKSTFINALIRNRLLKTDVLQGTTAAVTVIQYGEQLSVELVRRQKGLLTEFSKGVVSVTRSVVSFFSREKKAEPTEEEILVALHEATTTEEIAKDIMQVNVFVPAITLREGLVIVDTPGANANNPRHGEVTADAIDKLCDAALVVIPAEMAGSLSLVNYLKENAGDLIHRCIFLINKIDHIRRRKDQDQILDFMRTKIQQEFGLENPRILAAAPQFLVSALESGEPVDEDEIEFSDYEIERWVGEFEEMEQELRGCLIDKRLQAQVDDISLLLDKLYQKLGANLAEMIKEYEAQHLALDQLVIPDIETFIGNKAHVYTERASNQIKKQLRGAMGDLVDHAKGVVSAVRYAIINADDKKELSQAVEYTVPRIIRNGESTFVGMVQDLCYEVTKLTQNEYKQFHAEFQTHFRSLASLGGRIDVDQRVNNRSVANSNAIGELQSVTAQLSTGLQALQESDTAKMVGGGAAGAVAGTLILPGIGTIIGGIVGSLFSNFFGPSLDELKSECLQNVIPPLADSLDELIDRACDDVDEVCDEALRSLQYLILDYVPTYSKLVDLMRQRDRDEKQRVLDSKQRIEAEQMAIKHEEKSLHAIRNKIRQI